VTPLVEDGDQEPSEGVGVDRPSGDPVALLEPVSLSRSTIGMNWMK
jgi:hypothetical protein